MKSLALALEGPILTAVGLYYRHRKKSIGSWMQGRRIDGKEKIMSAICDKCGGTMKRRKYYSGHREGAAPLVCENWPDCRNVKWG